MSTSFVGPLSVRQDFVKITIAEIDPAAAKFHFVGVFPFHPAELNVRTAPSATCCARIEENVAKAASDPSRLTHSTSDGWDANIASVSSPMVIGLQSSQEQED